ncbi:MAG: hypothetical protein ACM3Y9_09600, partial [Ignavibacteria bacterium]
MKVSLRKQRAGMRMRLVAAAVLGCYAAVPAAAAPADIVSIKANDLKPTAIGSFKAYDVTNGVDVYNLAHRTAATAASFHVLGGQTFRVIQGASSDAFMIRVTGVPGETGKVLQQSMIAGNVLSNGQIYLMNSAGALIMPGAVVDTARFVASTLNLSDADFLAGRLTFQRTPNAADVTIQGDGQIINQGTIRTPSGGSVYLIGTTVRNEGLISTPQGETILAAGQT